MSIPSLRSSTDFERVIRSGRRVRRGSLAVYVRAVEGPAGSTPIGLAVRCNRAVDRNLLKRRLRSAWRSLSPPPGFEVVIRGSEETLALPYQQLEKQLKDALAQAGLERPAS